MLKNKHSHCILTTVQKVREDLFKSKFQPFNFLIESMLFSIALVG